MFSEEGNVKFSCKHNLRLFTREKILRAPFSPPRLVVFIGCNDNRCWQVYSAVANLHQLRDGAEIRGHFGCRLVATCRCLNTYTRLKMVCVNEDDVPFFYVFIVLKGQVHPVQMSQ